MTDITLERELEIYKQIYPLDTIEDTQMVDQIFFNYCKNGIFFILLVLYNQNGEICLKSNGVNQFGLIGGGANANDTIRSAIKRLIVERGITATIEAVEPICFLDRKYIFEGETVTHKGVALMVQLEEKGDSIKFYPLTDETLQKFNAFSDRQILSTFMKRYHEIVFNNAGNFQEEEILSNQKYRKRYVIHNQVVKRFLLTPTLKRKSQLIDIMRRKIDKATKLLDVSCGDNSLLFSYVEEIMERGGIVVANDISYSQIELISQKGVVFTQHNAISLPFKENSFDVVYCSNTLHHIPSREALDMLFKSLISVGKKVIIYEIEDPEITGGFHKFLNKHYYRGFLKDVGEQYLSKQEFMELIKGAFSGIADITFSSFTNVQGNYMIAEIVKK